MGKQVKAWMGDDGNFYKSREEMLSAEAFSRLQEKLIQAEGYEGIDVEDVWRWVNENWEELCAYKGESAKVNPENCAYKRSYINALKANIQAYLSAFPAQYRGGSGKREKLEKILGDFINWLENIESLVEENEFFGA